MYKTNAKRTTPWDEQVKVFYSRNYGGFNFTKEFIENAEANGFTKEFICDDFTTNSLYRDSKSFNEFIAKQQEEGVEVIQGETSYNTIPPYYDFRIDWDEFREDVYPVVPYEILFEYILSGKDHPIFKAYREGKLPDSYFSFEISTTDPRFKKEEK